MISIAQFNDASLPKKLALAFVMAAVTGLAAQVKIPLPFTPVPLTGQVFAVLFSGILLGSRFGVLSQLIYIVSGAAGIPWFAGLSGGITILASPTGGYILGFVPAAWIAGRFVWLQLINPPLPPFIKGGMGGFCFAMTLSILTIHLFGAAQFAFVMNTGLADTLRMAVIPFIGFDIAKAILVGVIMCHLESAAGGRRNSCTKLY